MADAENNAEAAPVEAPETTAEPEVVPEAEPVVAAEQESPETAAQAPVSEEPAAEQTPQVNTTVHYWKLVTCYQGISHTLINLLTINLTVRHNS